MARPRLEARLGGALTLLSAPADAATSGAGARYPLVQRDAAGATRAWVLLARGRSEQAARLAADLPRVVDALGLTGRSIEALTLPALARQAQGQRAAALTLTRARALARPEGSVRLRVDHGAPLADLPRAWPRSPHVAQDEAVRDYAASLLRTIESAGGAPSPPHAPTPMHRLPLSSTPVQPLSERELAVPLG